MLNDMLPLKTKKKLQNKFLKKKQKLFIFFLFYKNYSYEKKNVIDKWILFYGNFIIL